jgi:hypothetical protein
MKSPLNFLQTVALVVASLVAVTGRAPAQAPTNVDSSSLLLDYSADSLLNGSSVSSWTPSSGTNPEAATVANATATGFDTYTAPTVANTDAAFNGHQYVSFVSGGGSFQGLGTADNLGLTGTSNMSVAGVYATTSTPSDAGIAGLASINSGSFFDRWFDLQDRTFIVTGDPYLAGYADDLNSGGSPSGEVGTLTFALATYSVSGSSATFTLYWAYGLTGTVQSTSATLTTVDTTLANFELGYTAQDYNAGAGSPIELGQGLAWDTALSSGVSGDATTEIHNLQSFYAAAVPEPSTCALVGISLLAGMVFLRRRAIS